MFECVLKLESLHYSGGNDGEFDDGDGYQAHINQDLINNEVKAEADSAAVPAASHAALYMSDDMVARRPTWATLDLSGLAHVPFYRTSPSPCIYECRRGRRHS